MIYIQPHHSSKIGGPQTFQRNLRSYCLQANYPVAPDFLASNGIFFPITYCKRILNLYQNCGGVIIQRLDGIYYPSQHGKGYELQNQQIAEIYHDFVTHVVFQSEYSKRQCFAMLAPKAVGDYSIITNGANKSIFYPAEKIRYIDRNTSVRFIITGNFRKKGMFIPVINALRVLENKYNLELNVVGPVLDELRPLLEYSFIKQHGSQSMEKVAELLRSSDVFLHSQINDNCPNAVIEAISCGLPVVGFDSGAMRELCFFNTDLLAYVSEDLFQIYEDFDSIKLAGKIESCLENYEFYKSIALNHSRLYDFQECGARYVEVFEKELAKCKNIPQMKKMIAFGKYKLQNMRKRVGNRISSFLGNY